MQTDAKLVQLAMTGEKTAFGELVRRYQGLIYGLAYHQVRDFTDAQDIAQEAFIKAFRSLGQLDRPDRFAAWLKTITANEGRMWLRRRKQTVSIQEAESLPLDDDWERRERQSEVRQAVGSLPEKSRLMITLHYLSGLSHQEIGEFLNMPANAVAQHLHRARRQVKEMLMAQIEEDYTMNRLTESFTEEVLKRVTLFPVEDGKLMTAAGEGDARGLVMGVGDEGAKSYVTLWMRQDDLNDVVLGLYPARTSEKPKGRALDSALAMMNAFGAKLERVVLRLSGERKCTAGLELKRGKTEITVDMRPSDAMGLATRAKAPIFAEEPVVRVGNVGEDDVPTSNEPVDQAAFRSEFEKFRQHDELTGKAFELGVSSEDWIDTVRFHKDESRGVLRVWLEARPEKELTFDLKEYGPGTEMIFDLAEHRGSTGLLKGDFVRGWDKQYTVQFSMLDTDARMRVLSPNP